MKWYFDFADPLVWVLWLSPIFTLTSIGFIIAKIDRLIAHVSWWWLLIPLIPAITCDTLLLAFFVICWQMGKM